MSNRSTLTAQSLTKTYGPTTALAGVDLSIPSGQSLAVMGPSGSGKTTLLQCLAGVLPPSTGTVHWGGTDLSRLGDRGRTKLRRTDFGFVFQSGQLLPELPADENAALPLLLAGTPKSRAIAYAQEWLGYMGLAGMFGRRPGEMSGGQAQRVAIARSMVTSPGVIFADEPTGALDQQTGHEVLDILTRAAAQTGASLIVVTHEPSVAQFCARTVMMRDGVIYADGPSQPAEAAVGQGHR